MSAALPVTLCGTTFVVSDAAGDVDTGLQMDGGPFGLFHDDVRHLSRWRLTVDGRRLRAVGDASELGPTTSLLAEPGGETPGRVLRQRVVAAGLVERVRVANDGDERLRLRLRLDVDADFEPLLRLHGVETAGRSEDGEVVTSVRAGALTLTQGDAGTARSTTVSCDRATTVDELGVTVELSVAAHGHEDLVLRATPVVGTSVPLRSRAADFDATWDAVGVDIDNWLDRHPGPETPYSDLTIACRRGLADLAALRMRSAQAPDHVTVAAGVPWYVALFGRDALLASYFAVPFAPDLAAGTLHALAETQATSYDDTVDAEPGKIVHEVRAIAGLGDPPAHRYYGAVDATPLFLIVLEEYVAWTGDTGLAIELEPSARMALGWLEDPRVLHDGWVSYERRSSGGLVNQCWKDSPTSIRFADGRTAEPPIACCEVQGYTYDALIRSARLADDAWRDPVLARRLRGRAARLKERFDAAFWLADRGHYALARDGQGGLVDSLTSNIGHLLWSGIVPEERAGALAAQLVDTPLFTGRGVRTMASGEAAYDPLGYHTGAVWPHDTALAAAGLTRHGYRREALLLVEGLVRAAAAFDHRLPEVFAGCSTAEVDAPAAYPTSCRPQAWAAATPLLLARLVLDLQPAR